MPPSKGTVVVVISSILFLAAVLANMSQLENSSSNKGSLTTFDSHSIIETDVNGLTA